MARAKEPKVKDDRKRIDMEKMAAECRWCRRSYIKDGPCGGRIGQNICLAFKK